MTQFLGGEDHKTSGKRSWHKTFQFVVKIRHVKKSNSESCIIFICGFYFLCLVESISKLISATNHSVKRTLQPQPLLFYQRPTKVFFFLKKFLPTLASFLEGLCWRKHCFFISCLLFEKPTCLGRKEIFAHLCSRLRSRSIATYIYMLHIPFTN